jgi:hypothetical protein
MKKALSVLFGVVATFFVENGEKKQEQGKFPEKHPIKNSKNHQKLTTVKRD